MQSKRLLRLEWDTIAGIIAAVVAILMDLLGILPGRVVPTITLVLIALLFLRQVRSERLNDDIKKSIASSELHFKTLADTVHPATTLIGPHKLREESETFARHSRGEMIWFNVCLSMFRPQALFDVLLRPAIENPAITAIYFTLDEKQKALWDEEVLPKIEVCSGRHKIAEPHWSAIPANLSFVMSDATSEDNADCLLSFWGEPFMASSIGPGVPRYIFNIHRRSELVSHLRELERGHRVSVR